MFTCTDSKSREYFLIPSCPPPTPTPQTVSTAMLAHPPTIQDPPVFRERKSSGDTSTDFYSQEGYILDTKGSGTAVVAVAKKGTTFVCGHGKTVTLWGGSGIALLHTFTGHKNTVRAIAQSDDGSRAVSSDIADDGGGQVIVWDLVEKKAVTTINYEGSNGAVVKLDFAPDGATFALAHGHVKNISGGVHLRATHNGNMVHDFGHSILCYNDNNNYRYSATLRFSPNGMMLAYNMGCANFHFIVWNTKTKTLATAPPPYGTQGPNNWVGDRAHPTNRWTSSDANAFAFSPDSKLLASCGYRWSIGGTCVIWKTAASYTGADNVEANQGGSKGRSLISFNRANAT